MKCTFFELTQSVSLNPILIFLIGLNHRVEQSNTLEVYTEDMQTDKYGRILVNVYLGDLHINKWLIDNKFAINISSVLKKFIQIQSLLSISTNQSS